MSRNMLIIQSLQHNNVFRACSAKMERWQLNCPSPLCLSFSWESSGGSLANSLLDPPQTKS